MPEQDPPRRCYLIKPRWSDGGKQRRPNVVTLPATKGFGLEHDPRNAPTECRAEDFWRGRSRAPGGHYFFHDDTWWHASCFANAEDAAGRALTESRFMADK